MTKANHSRRVLRTVLLVGEGNSEVLFLEHLKSIYLQRGSGVAIAIKNANGKGAGHVVDYAYRSSRNADYDLRVALLDTDTDWNESVSSLAKKSKIQVLACEPCLEAVLLTIHQHPVNGLTTAQLKRRFLDKFGSIASEKSMLKHFSLDKLESAKLRVPVLNALISIMKTARLA